MRNTKSFIVITLNIEKLAEPLVYKSVWGKCQLQQTNCTVNIRADKTINSVFDRCVLYFPNYSDLQLILGAELCDDGRAFPEAPILVDPSWGARSQRWQRSPLWTHQLQVHIWNQHILLLMFFDIRFFTNNELGNWDKMIDGLINVRNPNICLNVNSEFVETYLSSDGGNVLHQGLNLRVHEVPWSWQRGLLLLFIWALRQCQLLEHHVPQWEASDPSRGDPCGRAHLPLLHQHIQPLPHGLGDRKSYEQSLGQLCHPWVSGPGIFVVQTILLTHQGPNFPRVPDLNPGWRVEPKPNQHRPLATLERWNGPPLPQDWPSTRGNLSLRIMVCMKTEQVRHNFIATWEDPDAGQPTRNLNFPWIADSHPWIQMWVNIQETGWQQ